MEVKSAIVLLKEGNYPTWKVQVKMCLMKDDLWDIVSGTEIAPTDASKLAAFNKRKDRALATIVLSVDPKLLYLIGDPVEPDAVWTKLQDVFQKKSWSNKLRLKKKLYNLKLADNGSMQEHLKSFVELFDALAVAGETIKDEDRVISLLASLPERYDTLVTTLETLDAVPSWEAVTERLLREEQKRQDYSTDKAYFTSKRRDVKNVQCYGCHRFGHIRRFCPKGDVRKEAADVALQNESAQHDRDEVVLAATTARNMHDGFLLDSACTQHMSHDKELFVNMYKSREKNVFVGNGKKLEVKGEGEIMLNVQSDSGNVRKCRLKSVLYVPNLTHNLMSISKISSGGKNVNFSENICKITQGNEVLAYGNKLGRLYMLKEGARGGNRTRDKVFFTTRSPRMMKENPDQNFSYALTAVSTGPLQRATRRVILCRNPVDCNHVSCHRLLRPY